jgi:hypothetical protein
LRLEAVGLLAPGLMRRRAIAEAVMKAAPMEPHIVARLVEMAATVKMAVATMAAVAVAAALALAVQAG